MRGVQRDRASWASWGDSLAMIRRRHPTVAELHQLEGHPETVMAPILAALWADRVWPNDFDLLCVVCLCECVSLSGVGACFTVSGVGFHVWASVSRFWFGHVRCPQTALPRDRPSPGPPKMSPRRVQNFALFFSLSRHLFRSFSLSLGVFSVEFWWCLKRRGAQMSTFGLSGAGASQNNQRTPNVHI